jgi:putative glycosyl transferase, group 1 family
MSEKMSVLHILHELHPSGAEMMIYNAYPYWKDVCNCSIMATGKIKGPFAGQLEQAGYETVWVPTEGNGKMSKVKHLISFWKYMRKHSYDIVHIHRESLAFEYALIAKITGSRHIVRTVHSTFAHTGIQRKIKAATRWIMRKPLRVSFVAISDGVAENEKQVFGNVCETTIYNWCNNQKFSFLSEQEKKQIKQEHQTTDKLVLVTVGNCGHVKNHELLLRAIVLMKEKDRILYRHVGYAKGETEREAQLAEKLGIQEQITFAGSTDPMPFLREADVFLMTSIYEGLSIATLEAIFTGMNVLLAETPGLTEFQGKGLENVDYFTSTPEKLSEKLDAYVKEYDKGKIRPSRAQRLVAEQLYDCEHQVEKYVMLYEKNQKRGNL